jgi:hypothetical protein
MMWRRRGGQGVVQAVADNRYLASTYVTGSYRVWLGSAGELGHSPSVLSLAAQHVEAQHVVWADDLE